MLKYLARIWHGGGGWFSSEIENLKGENHIAVPPSPCLPPHLPALHIHSSPRCAHPLCHHHHAATHASAFAHPKSSICTIPSAKFWLCCHFPGFSKMTDPYAIEQKFAISPFSRPFTRSFKTQTCTFYHLTEPP